MPQTMMSRAVMALPSLSNARQATLSTLSLQFQSRSIPSSWPICNTPGRRTDSARCAHRHSVVAASDASGAAAVATASNLKESLSDPGLLKTGIYLGGSWRSTEEQLEVINPATGSPIASVSHAGAVETQEAIRSAHEAFASWSQLTGQERGSYLTRWAQALEGAKDDIATIMTAECGKPLAESKAEFGSGVASVHWFAAEATRIEGDVLPRVTDSKRFVTMRQPVGVVGAITPWNFPMSMITRKVAPALAAGCTVVLKPAELTPLTALAMAELADRAGFPPGVLNILQGDAPAIGEELLSSREVRKIGFTGSTAVGQKLMAGAAKTIKKVSLELGGNAPFVVFADADLERAAQGTVAAALRNAGQTCICANRVFVQDSVYDEFAAILESKVAALKQGSGLEPGVTCGPLISPAGVSKVEAQVKDALSKGATATVGGDAAVIGGACSSGYFYPPTVLRGATPDMLCFREETFGPLVPLFRFSEEAEVIRLANDTEYGLAAYVYTRDIGCAWRMSEALDYGMVGVNEAAITSEVAPFGGMKMSGLGRENSKYGMDEFLELKTVCFGM